MEKSIEVSGLSKSFGDVKAVDNIDFYVEKGKLFAFLGPNGAGKSTTINMFCTFLSPDEGNVSINSLTLGKDDAKIRETIGIVFQEHVLDDLFTVKENLFARGRLYGHTGKKLSAHVEKAAEKSNVSEFLNRPYGKLSGGQRRRADIARALINSPDILFLDEPTTGLDPQTRSIMWETIKKLQSENGTTVFLTTHYMEEAAAADYIIIIDEGRIAARGTPNALRSEYTSDKLRLFTSDVAFLSSRLREENIVIGLSGVDFITVPLMSTLEAIDITAKLRDYITGFEVTRGSMDDVFLAVTGKEIKE